MIDPSPTNLSVFGATVFVFVLLGIVSAVQAVMTTRTSQGAVAWAITLVTWPFFAVPAYWIFGRNKFQGYVNLRRDRTSDAIDNLDDVRRQLTPYTVDLGTRFGEARALEQLARMRFTRNNDTRLLVNGRATFDAIFAEIDAATTYILVQFFIIHDDSLGRQLKDRLIAQAKRGLSVYLLYDDIGSSGIPKAFVNELTAAGVHITGMRTTRGWRNRFQINFRNHRKIVIVDGRIAFVGGHNVGDEYIGMHPRLTPWRDTHLSISGPAVLATQLAFVEDWYWATESMPDVTWEPQPSMEHDRMVFVLPSGPADDYETCGLFFTHAINSADDRIWIATPYFVPDEGVITALQLAALRGVDVRVLIPGIPDKPWIKLAAMSYVNQVLQAGVKVYEYGDGFLHQKVVLVDEYASAIGTANFDNRSFRLNFEITVLTIDDDFTSEVEQMLLNDFAHSKEITPDDLAARRWWSVAGSQIARLFAPIL
ncbi:Major cardiolipin synthase ClsA [Stieleria neptunia]|uniref:Cardiolipin synthase n=1 Tax=Stieleria neptunia TaxID=2527979 RepID=A0A518I3D9_9BACT|nr:cardiolipin synthase [Stieleria neptunia]QDV47621.1 Major cardiolipin synthase ClsA [Stieleria neptunia]